MGRGEKRASLHYWKKDNRMGTECAWNRVCVCVVGGVQQIAKSPGQNKRLCKTEVRFPPSRRASTQSCVVGLLNFASVIQKYFKISSAMRVPLEARCSPIQPPIQLTRLDAPAPHHMLILICIKAASRCADTPSGGLIIARARCKTRSILMMFFSFVTTVQPSTVVLC